MNSTELLLWALVYGGVVLIAFAFGVYVGLRTWKRIWRDLQEAEDEIKRLKGQSDGSRHE